MNTAIKNESLEAENAWLRARVTELEQPSRSVLRGFTDAVVEALETGLESGVNGINVFADGVFGQSTKSQREAREPGRRARTEPIEIRRARTEPIEMEKSTATGTETERAA